jgi:hypothetical protein
MVDIVLVIFALIFCGYHYFRSYPAAVYFHQKYWKIGVFIYVVIIYPTWVYFPRNNFLDILYCHFMRLTYETCVKITLPISGYGQCFTRNI